jgi:hypothetical protein
MLALHGKKLPVAESLRAVAADLAAFLVSCMNSQSISLTWYYLYYL